MADPLALPPQEADSCTATWLRPVAAPPPREVTHVPPHGSTLVVAPRLCLSERWAPMLPRGSWGHPHDIVKHNI
jgi:hypothetical protein